MDLKEKQYLVEWLETVNQATTKLIEKLKPSQTQLTFLQTECRIKKYSIKALSKIFNCSEPAIRKKIRTDNNNVKTFKRKYKVTRDWDGTRNLFYIHLSDFELEVEKATAMRNKRKLQY